MADCLFLGCNFFGSVWSLVLQWLDISSVASGVVRGHFLQFGHLTVLEKNVFDNASLSFNYNKVLKMTIGYVNICSSVQDHKQKNLNVF